MLALFRRCSARLVSALCLLTAGMSATGCQRDPSPPQSSSVSPQTPPTQATASRPAELKIELLMAGRPPQQSLALVDVASGEDAHPISISATGYGPDGEVRRKIRGTLRNTTTKVADGFEHTLQVDAPKETSPAPFVVVADPWGPTEAFEGFSDDPAVEAVLRSLLVPVPEDTVGEGAVYRVDVPFRLDGQNSALIIRTTAEVLETFSDGYLLKTDTVLHDAHAPSPLETEGKAEAARAAVQRRNEFVMTSRQWRHYDRVLPAKAYGQYRGTDRREDPPTTLIVDWSLDGAAAPAEAP